MASLSLSRSRQAPAEDSPAFGGIAERFRRGGDLDRAIALCREGLVKFPNQLSARVTLGWALLDKGEYAAAQTELEQVLRRAPDNLAAIRGLAELHERAEMAMPALDGDSHWAPAAEPSVPDVPELPPVKVVTHVPDGPAAFVPVDAQGNPLVVATPGVESAEPIIVSAVVESPAPVAVASAPAPAAPAPRPAFEPAPVLRAAAHVDPILPSVADETPFELLTADVSVEAFDSDLMPGEPAVLTAAADAEDLTAIASVTFESEAPASIQAFTFEPAAERLEKLEEFEKVEGFEKLEEFEKLDGVETLEKIEAIDELDAFVEAEAPSLLLEATVLPVADEHPIASAVTLDPVSLDGPPFASAEFDLAAFATPEAEVAEQVTELPADPADLQLSQAFAALEADAANGPSDETPEVELLLADAAPVDVDIVGAAPVLDETVGFDEFALPLALIESEMDPAAAVADVDAPMLSQAVADIAVTDDLEEAETQAAIDLATVEALAVDDGPIFELVPPTYSDELVDEVDDLARVAQDQDEVSEQATWPLLDLAAMASDDAPEVDADADCDSDTDSHVDLDPLDEAPFLAPIADAAFDALVAAFDAAPAAPAMAVASDVLALSSQPTITGRVASRRRALPALERLLRQVEARRLQLASGPAA